MDGGQVADGEFLVASGHRPMLFELVDATFDSVAVSVDNRIERWRSATARTAVAAMRSLVRRNWDGHPDSVPA